MKKLFLSVLMVASAITFTSAQSAAVGDSPEASKWSIGLKGGGTYYRITPAARRYLDQVSWGAGLIIERTASPLFGMGLDVSYLNYPILGDYKGKTIDQHCLHLSIYLTCFPIANLLIGIFTQNLVAVLQFGYDNPVVTNKPNGGPLKKVMPVFTAAIHPSRSW